MTSIRERYEKIEKENTNLPSLNDMVFYTGSPRAKILVVSEAPTESGKKHTLFSYIRDGDYDGDICSFLEKYPFREQKVHNLYRFYREVFGFLNEVKNQFGFTDLYK